jgi:hypothetical protein
LDNKTSSSPKISPDDYKKVLKGIQLKEIILEECSARIRKIVGPSSLQISVKDKIKYKLISGNGAHVSHSYNMVGTSDSEKDYTFKISCTFRLEYYSDIPLSKEFMDIFSNKNITLNSWPYFREFAQNITQRMNIPPVVLPLLKS